MEGEKQVILTIVVVLLLIWLLPIFLAAACHILTPFIILMNKLKGLENALVSWMELRRIGGSNETRRNSAFMIVFYPTLSLLIFAPIFAPWWICLLGLFVAVVSCFLCDLSRNRQAGVR